MGFKNEEKFHKSLVLKIYLQFQLKWSIIDQWMFLINQILLIGFKLSQFAAY